MERVWGERNCRWTCQDCIQSIFQRKFEWKTFITRYGSWRQYIVSLFEWVHVTEHFETFGKMVSFMMKTLDAAESKPYQNEIYRVGSLTFDKITRRTYVKVGAMPFTTLRWRIMNHSLITSLELWPKYWDHLWVRLCFYTLFLNFF